MEQTSITHQSTVAEILRDLRKDIILGKYGENQPVSETEIALKYQVSRSSVRSAFQALERDGLLEISKTGRKCIKGMDQKKLRDFCDTRAMLDCEAATLILEKEENDFSGLLKIVTEFYLAMYSPGPDQKKQIVSINDRFHKQLYIMAGNIYLQKCYDTIAPIISVLGEVAAHYNLTASAHDYYVSHKKIADLLMAKDREVLDFIRSETVVSAYRDAIKAIEMEKVSSQ